MKRSKIREIVFKTGGSVLLCAFLLFKIDFQRITITSVEWWFLPPMAASVLGAYLMRSLFYRKTAGAEGVTRRIFFQITGVYNFISSILPFGLGHFSYPWLLKKHYGVPLVRGLSSLIFYNALRVLLLAVIFALSGSSLRLYRFLPWPVLKIGMFFTCALLGAAIFLKFKGIGDIGVVRKYREGAAEILDDLKKNLRSDRASPLVSYSAAVIALNICSVFFSYRFFHQSPPAAAILFLYSAGNLSKLFPVHGPAGLGSFEAINAAILLGIQYSVNEAIQLSFAVHLLGLAVQGLIAAPCYLFMRLSAKRSSLETVH